MFKKAFTVSSAFSGDIFNVMLTLASANIMKGEIRQKKKIYFFIEYIWAKFMLDSNRQEKIDCVLKDHFFSVKNLPKQESGDKWN